MMMNILLLYVSFRVFGGDAVTNVINSADDNQNNNIPIIMRFVIHQLFIMKTFCNRIPRV